MWTNSCVSWQNALYSCSALWNSGFHVESRSSRLRCEASWRRKESSLTFKEMATYGHVVLFLLPAGSLVVHALHQCRLCGRHHRWLLHRSRQVNLYSTLKVLPGVIYSFKLCSTQLMPELPVLLHTVNIFN